MKNERKHIKKSLSVLVLCVLILSALCSSLTSCGEEEVKLISKTEAGLNFVIPENFERTYKIYDTYKDPNDPEKTQVKWPVLEYSNDEIGFVVDLKQYSDYELSYGATVKQCTEAIIDKMGLDAAITYDDARNVAQFDTWASDEEGAEAYYSYIVILPAANGIYIARYVCEGSEETIEKHVSEFAEWATKLSVVNA